LLPKDPILFDQVLDPRLLSALDPAGERPHDELQEKTGHESHRIREPTGRASARANQG
jgi:hypothetical protein